MKLYFKKKFKFFILPVSIILLITIIFVGWEWFTGELSMMKCRKLGQIEMDKMQASFSARSKYVLGEEERVTIDFKFNLNIKNNDKLLFMIFSQKMDSIVYSGSYKQNLSIEVGSDITTDGGYDNLEFSLLQQEKKEVCTWTNERGYPYWDSNAKIDIVFLDNGVFDKDELFKQFDITIQRDKMRYITR